VSRYLCPCCEEAQRCWYCDEDRTPENKGYRNVRGEWFCSDKCRRASNLLRKKAYEAEEWGTL